MKAKSFLVVLAALVPVWCYSLIMTGQGNKPTTDRGWPEGALALANLEIRVGWWEGPPFGGGESQFLYRGDADALSFALTKFAAIQAPELDLVLHDGPAETPFLNDPNNSQQNGKYDWSFTIWNPESWHRLYNNPKSSFGADQPNFRKPVAPPRLDVFVGGGSVDWAAVKVPRTLHVKDERASASGTPPELGTIVRADVYDMSTGKPVPGARVIVAKLEQGKENPNREYQTFSEVTADAKGRAQAERIPAGSYRISVQADGYATRMLGYETFREHGLKTYTIELCKTAMLSGIVLDSTDKPVPGVKVRSSNPMGIDGRGYASPDGLESETDSQGHFTLAGLPKGYTQLSAHASDFYFGDFFTVHDAPSKDVVLHVSRSGKIKVTVTDATGKPLDKFQGNEVMVSVEAKEGAKVGTWGGSATVHKDGTYEFTGVPAGEYRLSTRPNPSNSTKAYAAERLVKLEPGKSAEVTFVYR